MPRVTGRPASRKRRKKVLKRAKGFVGGRRKLIRTAKETVTRAEVYATRDRKLRKREFRTLWNARINAACRSQGITYSRLIAGLKAAKVELNRKALAEIAARDEVAFKAIVALCKKS